MQTRVEMSVDKRRIVTVTYTPPSPDPANTPAVDVVFDIEKPSEDDFTLKSNASFLTLLSATRTDTREKVVLDPDELRQVKRAAAVAAASDTSDW